MITAGKANATAADEAAVAAADRGTAGYAGCYRAAMPATDRETARSEVVTAVACFKRSRTHGSSTNIEHANIWHLVALRCSKIACTWRQYTFSPARVPGQSDPASQATAFAVPGEVTT